jgi:hypothetical protein
MGSGISHNDTGASLTRSQYVAGTSHEIASGTSFPTSPNEKELFYRLDLHQLYIYNGTDWDASASTGVTGLAVSGSSLATGNLYLTGSGNVTITRVGKSFYISGSSTTGSIVFTEPVILTGSINVGGNAVVTGSFSGSTIHGTSISGSGVNATTVTGITVSGSNLQGQTLTVSSASIGSVTYGNIITTNVVAVTVTGSSILSGSNIYGNVSNIVTANATNLSGSQIYGSNALINNIVATNITGSTISGSNIIGTIASTSITSQTITGSTHVSGSLIYGATAKITNVNATNITGSFISGSNGVFNTLTGSTISGSNIIGTFSGSVSAVNIIATNITGSTISGSSTLLSPNATITNITATNITAGTVNATNGIFDSLTYTNTNINAVNISGSGEETLGGNLYVKGVISGSSYLGLSKETEKNLVWREGSLYYIKDGHSGAVSSGAVFSTLVNSFLSTMVSGSIYFKAGAYTVSGSALSLTGKSNISLIGETGTIFTIDSGLTVGIYGAGTVSATVTETLTSNAEINSSKINVASTSGFAADNWVRLKSDDAVNPEYPAIDKAEIKQIESLVTNTSFTFVEPFIQQYTTSNNALIALVTPLENLVIKGISFVGSNPAGDQTAIQLIYGVHIRVTECTFNDCGTTAIDLLSVVHSEADKNYVNGSRKPGSGYGVCIEDASSNCLIHDNIWVDCRHGFSINASENIGTCLYIHIYNNQAIASTAWGIDVHGMANYIYIENNVCNGFTFTGSDTYGAGIVSGANITYINNNYVRGGETNACHGITYRGQIYEVYVNGNTVEDLSGSGGSHGILFGGATLFAGAIINNVVKSGYYAIRLGDFTATKRFLVSNNILYGTYGLRVDNVDNVDVVNNSFLGTLTIENTNGSTSINAKNNVGHVTENSGTGTVTAGLTSVVVTHGLSVTPTLAKIRLTPQDNLSGRAIWVSTATSTQFTINIGSGDAVNHAIGWSYGE